MGELSHSSRSERRSADPTLEPPPTRRRQPREMRHVGSQIVLDDRQRLGRDGFWMMIFGGLFWLVLVVLGAAGAVRFVRASRRRGLDVPTAGRNYPALEILEQRYAHGEINSRGVSREKEI